MGKLLYLGKLDSFDCYEFKASLFHYFYKPMAYYEKLLSRTIRETMDYIRGGYKVIYLFEGDCPVAYLTILRGGGRYAFSTPQDILVCNVWVDTAARGKGLGNVIYRAPFTLLDLKYEHAYCFIRHDNIPSIKAACNAGFVLKGNLETVGYLHTMREVKKGGLGLYVRN